MMKKNKLACFFGLVIFMHLNITAKEYHVDMKGNNSNDGLSPANSFKTISHAAKTARPGDTITVYEGTYREWVSPARGGTHNLNRIVYRAAPGEKVIIKGSEIIKNWERVTNGVWKVTIQNSFFGEYNPYQDTIKGDWFKSRGRKHLTGEVYLNEKALYEVTSFEMLKNPVPFENSREKEKSLYQWYAESNEETTTIWANFHKFNPNNELVEINVRKACFYPKTPGINYIIVQGFHMSQAATQWAPPTAEQIGLIGTHWSKGWIIENNIISNSKCVGITLGKDRATGHNAWMNNPVKDGATIYNEVITKALHRGWSKENIGSHVVRNNEIFHCEQAGLVGSLGGVFSQIYNNYIHDIWIKRMFSGSEIAGIKIHASVDMLIKNNRINNAGRGIWIDWMAQGTRISGNLLYDNTTDDIFSEVNHGPYLIDNNILLSNIAFRDMSQGAAFVHNLVGGQLSFREEKGRYTPYHYPHSTQVAGWKNISGGDNRFINNIFVKIEQEETESDEQKFFQSFADFYGLSGYEKAGFQIIAEGNVYCLGAKPGLTDSDFIYLPEFDPKLRIKIGDSDQVTLHFSMDKTVSKLNNNLVTTRLLGSTIISEASFENPDGTPLKIDEDYLGNKKNQNSPSPGPFENITDQNEMYIIW
ncbi:MAG: right-handed parallel beta-helix repeat-containing protein [Bacteroidota bacterium]